MTYCCTTAALCVLEKLVHVEDPDLLPDDLLMVRYQAPDALDLEVLEPEDLPDDWRRDVARSRALGDAWLDRVTAPLLRVPSVILPLADCPDRNVIVNHRHPRAGEVTVVAVEHFELDVRLLRF